MADTCSKVIVGNEGYSKAALRQMLGNMMDMFQSTGTVDIPALGNFLSQLVDTMPDADPVSVIGPGEVGPADLGGEELGDESNVRLEYSQCPDYVEEYPYDSCAFSCSTAVPIPRRLRMWIPRGVKQLYANIPLLVWDGESTPCRPSTWQFVTEVESDCTLVTEDLTAQNNLYYGWETTGVVGHSSPGVAWTSDDLDDLHSLVVNGYNATVALRRSLMQLIKQLGDYYDLVQYGWCTPPDYG
jgi:hypothetical protein